MIYDVIIIGGGPAGLNAAVVLGRCLRKVLLFDSGKQRNLYSHGMHNYLTRDNIRPGKFLELSRVETEKYGVQYRNLEITKAKKVDDIFEVTDKNNKKHYSKKLILATGLSDILPKLTGAKELYGKSMHHCPYCDGWEVRHKRIGIYAESKNGIDLALILTTWSKTITFYTNNKKFLRSDKEAMLNSKGIAVHHGKIKALNGNNGFIKDIEFTDGTKDKCEALFFSTGYEVQCDLVENLGCYVDKKNVAITTRSQQTNIPGLYVVGDASRDMHFVVVAAAEGAKAGVYINKELNAEDLGKL
ncbi:MAG: NAD(P)/FAD-dependent oxidoreductase [Ginsengibacter sp.]